VKSPFDAGSGDPCKLKGGHQDSNSPCPSLWLKSRRLVFVLALASLLEAVGRGELSFGLWIASYVLKMSVASEVGGMELLLQRKEQMKEKVR
jgi:hypothetical protein